MNPYPDTLSHQIRFDTGWNLITIPVGNNWWASTLGDIISGCQMISWFNASDQSYETYIVGGPPGFDFPIVDGYGLFVLVNTDNLLTMMGESISSVGVSLLQGWNMIGWYQTYNTTASSLASNISGCEMVSWFNATTQSYETYILGGPPGFDFVISPVSYTHLRAHET